MAVMYRIFKKINKYIFISFYLFFTSCQTQIVKNNFDENIIIGTNNSKSIKFSDLTPKEKSDIISAQKKVYETAQMILSNYYLNSYFKDYQINNKINDIENAKKEYFAQRIKITDGDVQNFLNQNIENHQLQQIPEKEKYRLVKQYLTQLEKNKIEQSIYTKAIKEGKIKITGIEKPVEISFNFNMNGYLYDNNLKKPKITIVEFADYQCPYCVQAHSTIEKVLSNYKGKVQYIFRDFPLNEIHPEAMPAAIAAKCASHQGKFWEMHRLLFNRSPMSPLSEEIYSKFASELKLNMETFKLCQEDKDQYIKNSIQKDINEGNNAGVNATPFIFINGKKYDGNLTFEEIKKEIDEQLLIK